jgi:hypothetical protein
VEECLNESCIDDHPFIMSVWYSSVPQHSGGEAYQLSITMKPSSSRMTGFLQPPCISAIQNTQRAKIVRYAVFSPNVKSRNLALLIVACVRQERWCFPLAPNRVLDHYEPEEEQCNHLPGDACYHQLVSQLFLNQIATGRLPLNRHQLLEEPRPAHLRL